MALSKSPPVNSPAAYVAGTQRAAPASGDQRAATDDGAASVRIGSRRERLIAGFHHAARTANVVGRSHRWCSLQRGVVDDVAAAQRLNVAGDQRARR